MQGIYVPYACKDLVLRIDLTIVAIVCCYPMSLKLIDITQWNVSAVLEQFLLLTKWYPSEY